MITADERLTFLRFIDGSFAKLDQESWLLYTALGGSVVADVMITVSLCVLLGSIRTGFKP